MSHSGLQVVLAAVLVVGSWACDDEESTMGTTSAGGAAGTTASGTGGTGGGDGSNGLACNEYCGPVVGCSTGVTTQDCLTQCLAAPELGTDQCHAAYRARNQCVGELDCAEYDQFDNGTGGSPPCADEVSAIIDACAS
jgi:hypothetical protein